MEKVVTQISKIAKSSFFLAIIAILIFVSSIPKVAVHASTVSISINQEPNMVMIPSETRRFYATVTNGTDNTITWSVSGGGSIVGGPFNSGWVDVQAPSVGTSCTYTGSSPNYTVSTSTHLVITATSDDDNTKTATLTVNICDPTVSVNVVPGYRVLYSGQKADLQSFVLGNVNTDVNWAITNSPNGGDGALVDSVNRDTVFSATVAGRYTVRATSAADNTKTSTSILYVTGNAMPYSVTLNGTEPIDCSVDPNSTGTVYDVGPARSFTTIGAVPWDTLPAGSTIRIHNDDLTGSSPTTYHEYFNIKTAATQTNPVRVVGCPDSNGNLPIIDGINATSTTNPNPFLVGNEGIGIWQSNFNSYGVSNGTQPAWISIEGLSIRDFNDTNNYFLPNSSTQYEWGQPEGGGQNGAGSAFVAAIRNQNGDNVNIDGNEMSANGIGVFSEAQAPEGRMSRWFLVEGNNLHGNVKGKTLSETGSIHTLYIQSFGEVIQGNFAGNADVTGQGGDLKDRGAYSFVRYNTFSSEGDNTGRTIDAVDQQDAAPYIDVNAYLTQELTGNPPDNALPIDYLAAWVAAWHNYYIYGNVIVSDVLSPVHYNADHDEQYGVIPRFGTLWYWGNTGYEKNPINYDSKWFDMANADLETRQTEFQQVQSYNNIIWMDGTTTTTNPFFTFSRNRALFLNQQGTITPSTCCTNNQVVGGSGSGWSLSQPETDYYTGADNLSSHLQGFGATGTTIPNTVSTIPFDVNTYVPTVGSNAVSLPSQMANLPLRFQPGITSGIMAPRNDGGSSVGAVSASSLQSNPPGAPTSVVATPGNAQASVAFSAPGSNGGATITGYTVTSSPGGITATGSTSPIVVSGLTNGTPYTFTVTATNVNGTGSASSPSSAVTPNAGTTAPGAPTGATATAGNASATVTFTAPSSNGGSTITGYTVISNPSGGSDTNTGSTSLSHAITGLTNGIAYTFTVTATNSIGTGSPSSASNSVTPATVPGAPTGVVATPGNAQASIAFSAPSSNGGSAITGYTVTSSPGSLTASGSTSPIIVTGLTNGTPYTFTVTATNGKGNSSSSSQSSAVTPSLSGQAPIISNVQVSGIALDNALITWTTDTASTSQVFYGGTTSYGSSTTLADNGGVTVHSVIVSGLSPSTFYHFKVESTDLNSLTTDSSDQNFTTTAVVVSGGGGGGGGGAPTGIPAGTIPTSPIPPVSITTARVLINDRGTLYVIQNNQKVGIPSLAVLQSNGFTVAQATPATPAQSTLPLGSLLTLRDGTLIKTASDPTVYLVANQQRHPFVSGDVFNGQGYSFGTVLTVAPAEANALPIGPMITSTQQPHDKGVNINNNGTIYWVGGAQQVHAYTSAIVYNEWNVPNDFSTVVPANPADKALTVGLPVLK